MPVDPAKKLAELVQQAGRLKDLPEHQRTEAEKGCFGEVRRGLLVESALAGPFEQSDMVAMLELMVSTGQRKKLHRGRAGENLALFLASKPWLKAAHCTPELLAQLKEFLIDNPDVKCDPDVASLLEAPPADSSRASGAAKPAVTELDDEATRLIRMPLEEGMDVMRECKWQCDIADDRAGQGFTLFLRGVTRLAETSLGKEAMEASGSKRLPVLDALEGDWPKVIGFLASVHDAKRLRRSQVEMCAEKLRTLSESFAEAEVAAAEGTGLPWALPGYAPVGGGADDRPAAEAAEAAGEATAEEVPAAPSASSARPEATEELPAPPPPGPPPPAAALATVVMPKASPPPAATGGGGYPAPAVAPTDSGKEKPGFFARLLGAKDPEPAEPAEPAAPAVPVVPGVVWVDVNPKAYGGSILKDQEGMSLKGFDDKAAGKPWLQYIFSRATTHERVAVVIMNRRHKADAVQIKEYCKSNGLKPPTFIVCCGKSALPDDVCREWGMRDIQVVNDWAVASRNALTEVKASTAGASGSLDGEPAGGEWPMADM